MNSIFSACFVRLFLVALLIASLPARADFYEVEMTVFTNEGLSNINEQTWPQNINVEYPPVVSSFSNMAADEIYPELINPNKPSIYPNLIPLLNNTFSQHGSHVSKLQQSGEHRILFSKTWLQKMENKDSARNIIIQGGTLNSNTYELGGTATLFYTLAPDNPAPVLHVKTHLWRVMFASDNEPGINGWPIPVGYTITDDGATPMNLDKNVRIKRIGVLNTSEIISQSTLHYIDHPLFGVLIEVRPYSAIKMND